MTGRPTHKDPVALLLIGLGGALGTGIRSLLEQGHPAPSGGWPWTTFAINVTGAFVLGALLEGLSRSGPDTGWRRRARLTLGTGVLGGYTTYSTLAVETVGITTLTHPLTGPAYAVASVVLGVLASAGGFLLVRGIARHRPTSSLAAR